jgi:hypothetical protein
MSCLKMADIKVRIMDRLLQAGYLPVQQDSYVKWSKSYIDCAWFSEHTIQTTINNEASEIIRRIAGAPNGDASESQQGKIEAWYTDGYRRRAAAAI